MSDLMNEFGFEISVYSGKEGTNSYEMRHADGDKSVPTDREVKLWDALLAARADRQRLVEALNGLAHRPGECWCDMAIGNPMLHSHTEACKSARAALESVEPVEDDPDKLIDMPPPVKIKVKIGQVKPLSPTCLEEPEKPDTKEKRTFDGVLMIDGQCDWVPQGNGHFLTSCGELIYDRNFSPTKDGRCRNCKNPFTRDTYINTDEEIPPPPTVCRWTLTEPKGWCVYDTACGKTIRSIEEPTGLCDCGLPIETKEE